MIPIIFQHVRELAEAHSPPAERDRYKIITPFPPSGPDFPDFNERALEFGNPPLTGDSASQDTVRAFDFFNRTDDLYYDYSYGIRSDEYRLSHLCQKFFLNGTTAEGDLDFRTSFDEKRNAFLQRYLRSTVGDLGLYDFRYTSPSPASWNSDRVVLPSSEVGRLKAKAMAVYEDLDVGNAEFVAALVEGIRSEDYESVAYDFGFFDVVREWMDPRLFEHSGWTFASGSRQLYGEGDPYFAENDLKLCFAQRFYLVRNCTAVTSAAPAPGGPLVRDHRAIDDRRRVLRNALIDKRLAGIGQTARAEILASAAGPMERLLATPLTAAVVSAPPEPRPGFVWVGETATVPGHWERERAGAEPASPPVAPVSPPVYRVAAVKCRLLSPRP